MARKLEDVRAESDILTVYEDKKIYMNEKNFRIKVIKALHEVGFYIENESLFCYNY